MTFYQLDICAPSGREPIPAGRPDPPAGRLRRLVWQRIGGRQAELYAVARRVGWSSYEVTQWLRGDVEIEDEQRAAELLEYGSGR